MEKIVEQIRETLYRAGLLPLRSQAQVAERLLTYRLEVLLPKLMEETGIDLWLVPGYETNEDPVMWTMMTSNMCTARRLSALLHYRDPATGRMEHLVWGIGFGQMLEHYTSVKQGDETLCEGLTRELERLNPQKIGINISSELGGFCGGLSASLYHDLTTQLPETYRQRLCPAGRLATRWLETMTPGELEVMETLSQVTEDLMHAFYSRDVITPGVTTVEDVMWFIKDVMSRCEMDFWFDPQLDYQRQGELSLGYGTALSNGADKKPVSSVIQEGDLLHCDIGLMLKYIPVLTDRQWMAYVLRAGETRAPEGLHQMFRQGNHFQDLVCEGFLPGRTGNQVFWDGIRKARAAGLDPMLYCHGLGVFGHNAGPIIGLIDCQGDVYPRGELPVGYGSTHALELQHSAPLPEWGGQLVRMYLEEDIHVTDAPAYVGHRLTDLLEF